MRPTANHLEITYQPWSSLQPNPQNARTHSKRQVKLIAESIKSFGFTNPVLFDQNRTIIAGNGRVEAAKLLGLAEVPTICLESLNPDQIRAYAIADNRLAEKAGWDKSILAIELQHLLTIESEFDITVTGFEIPEIDLLLSSGEDTADDLYESGETSEAVTRPGDLWQLGKHQIVCGSAIEEDTYTKLLGQKKASVIFTDPPIRVHVLYVPRITSL